MITPAKTLPNKAPALKKVNNVGKRAPVKAPNTKPVGTGKTLKGVSTGKLWPKKTLANKTNAITKGSSTASKGTARSQMKKGTTKKLVKKGQA